MSDGNQAAEFIYLMAVLVLVISALMVRKIPIGQGLKMFAGWVMIFLAAFVAFPLRLPVGRLSDLHHVRHHLPEGVGVGEQP